MINNNKKPTTPTPMATHCGVLSFGATGAGPSGTPPMVVTRASTPAEIAPSASPVFRSGVMRSSMMREDSASVSTALEPVADLDAQRSVVGEDEEHRAVVEPLAPHLPRSRNARSANILDGLARGGLADPHQHLVTGGLLVGREAAVERGSCARGDSSPASSVHASAAAPAASRPGGGAAG